VQVQTQSAKLTKHFISFLSKHETFASHFSRFRGTEVWHGTQFGKFWSSSASGS